MMKFDLKSEGAFTDLATSMAAIATATGAFCTISVSIDGRPGDGDEDAAVAPAADAPMPGTTVSAVHSDKESDYDPHVSTRGFRRGDRVVDIKGDYATVVGTPNGHTEVLFDGMRQFSVMVGVQQDILTKVPDQKTMEEPVSASPWKYQLGSQVVLETSREAYAGRKQQEEIDAKRKGQAGRFEDLALLSVFHGPIEEGHVIGRAHHSNGIVKYEVRYRSGCGSQVEVWMDEDAICQPWLDEVAEKTDGE